MCQVKTTTIGSQTLRIADIKEKYISNVIDAANQCDIIDRIVLFGSATGGECKEESDIDLAIFGNQTEYKALRSKKYSDFTTKLYSFDDAGQSYDLLYFTSGKNYKGLIMSEIENGELIYART